MEKLFYYLSAIQLSQGKISDIEVLRTGTIQDRGLEITRKMLEEYVENFKNNVYGTELQVNLEHNRGSEAAGWIKDLYIATQPDGSEKLMAKVEWTVLGQEKISKNLFKFVSAELASEYPHHETGKLVNNVFIGLALTNTPALKGQQPVSLSEAAKKLISNTRMLKKLLAEMKKRSFVSAQDKALVKTLLEEATDAEKSDVAADAAEVEKKPEAPEKTEEEKAAEAKAAEEAAKKAEDEKAAAAAAATSDQLKDNVAFKALSEQNNQLKEKVERMELSETVELLMVNGKKADDNGNTTGFVGKETKEKVITFMLGLTPAQRETFKTLVNAVQTVDLASKGKSGDEAGHGEPDGDELEDKMAAYAEKCLKDGTAKNIEEAQKLAFKHFNKGK